MGHCKSNTVLLVPGAEWKRVNNRYRLTNPLQHSTIKEKHTHSAVKSFINLPSSACAVKSFINHDFNPIYIAFSYCLRG
jgi:CRISPR/Cas system CSM-associated protein Csm5 (group 7 of RAMP superfamily)